MCACFCLNWTQKIKVSKVRKSVELLLFLSLKWRETIGFNLDFVSTEGKFFFPEKLVMYWSKLVEICLTIDSLTPSLDSWTILIWVDVHSIVYIVWIICMLMLFSISCYYPIISYLPLSVLCDFDFRLWSCLLKQTGDLAEQIDGQ